MRGKLIVAVALVLGACGPRVEENTKAPAPLQASPQSETNVAFREGTDVGVAVFRDTTGCEWLIFRYRGYGISTQPRMKPGPNTQQVQICRKEEKE